MLSSYHFMHFSVKYFLLEEGSGPMHMIMIVEHHQSSAYQSHTWQAGVGCAAVNGPC